MLVNSFHEVINPPEQRRKKKKQLPTMCAPRRLSVNSIHRARAIVLNKANPRSRVISRQRAVPLQHQQPDDQQQQQQKLAEMVPKKKERLNFDNEPLQQVQQHQQVQQQNGEPGQLDEDVNVTTLTTGALEIVEENTPSPIVRPPRRAAAQAASQRFVLQCKPKHQHTVQQQQLPKRPRRAQLDNVPTHLINESAQLDDEPTTTPLASPPPPPATNVADIETVMGEQQVASLTLDPAEDETGQVATMTAEERKKINNRLKRQRKLENKQHDTSFQVRIVTPVPQVVQQQQQKRRKAVDEEEEEFEIKALLALFVHTDGERAYYVDWKIARGQESWVIAPDMVACVDAATRLTELTTVSGTLAAILGHDTPHHLLCILEQDAQYHEVKALVGTSAPARTARDIMFSKDATQRQRTKAIEQLDQFVMDCMSEEAIALYKEKERKKEEKKKQQQQMNGVEKRK